MSTARRTLRLAASACLALYLVLVGVVPVLHAVDAAPQSTQWHLHGDDGHCDPGHDELHCAPCQLAFGTAAEPGSRLQPRLAAGGPGGAARPRLAGFRSPPAASPSLPRAPPALR